MTREAIATLRAAGVDNPGLEVRMIAAAAADAEAFAAMVARRAAHEPMAYILGRKGFWTLELEVSPATLIPRPDSESLIEAAVAAFPDRGVVRRILDLGTGTGCLLLAALVEFHWAWGIGSDRVPAAVALARRNAEAAGMAGRAAFLCADWAAPLAGGFELILCNPPYIARDELANLMPDVAAYEPASALDGGVDGLDAYRAVMPVLARRLAPGGVAILELGQGQVNAVTALARAAGFDPPALRKDLGGVTRAMILGAPRSRN